MALRNRQPIEWSRERSERLFAENRLLPGDVSTRRVENAFEVGYHKSLIESIIMAVLFPAGLIAGFTVGAVWVLVETSVLRESAFTPLVLVISGLYMFAAFMVALYAWVRWKSRRGDVSIRFEDGDFNVFGTIIQSVSPTSISLIFGHSNNPDTGHQTVTYYGHALLETDRDGTIQLFSWAGAPIGCAPSSARNFAKLLRIPVTEYKITGLARLKSNAVYERHLESKKI